MTRTELIRLLNDIGLHPSRKLGQNFLIDANLLDWLVRTAAPAPGEAILEIGPGTGVLTRKLVDAGAELTAVELDHRLAAHIGNEFGGTPGFRLVQGDACDQDYDALMGTRPYRCIANLPYAVSSIVLARFLELRNPPAEIFVLLQLEMAARMRAVPSTKEYGGLSVQMQLDYNVEILRRVPPQVFFPPPEVDSAFVRFTRRPLAPELTPELRRLTREIARLGFGQRRKQLRKLLSARFPVERLDAAFAALNLPADARAEILSPRQFFRLAQLLG